ncbi:inorganic pyrophosphatase [Spinellus fusiger]|nr:inorganic pyrophosphatase [Spinellus fusiger]
MMAQRYILLIVILLTPIFATEFTRRVLGTPHTSGHKIYFEKEGHVISPFHDIPLFANTNRTLLNMIVEIPRWTNAKFEINKEILFNPIVQDMENGRPRFISNIFPYKGYLWNYGAFPQTWEDPNHITPESNTLGDNDPIDVLEIGEHVAQIGEIKQVKLLGILGLIDQHQTDWKVLAIDVNDRLASKLNDIEDVEKEMPGLIDETVRLLVVYKTPTGRKRNKIMFHGKPQNKNYAMQRVLETYDYWRALVNGTADKKTIQTVNLSVEESPYRWPMDNEIRLDDSYTPPLTVISPSSSSFDTWHYVHDQ